MAGPTLRQLAMRAIADTRFVPEKGRNRLGSMVEGRPDWVISRQRAWGVPIALFVEKKTQALLVDPEVNQRIVAAINEQGVDAWSEENAAAFLGAGRNPDDYEMIGDILDVWFDSGSTHAFVLESGRWPDQRWPADLYLEGSDQHRGWFQSSLLESCGTRGRAPFDAVLTHGFTHGRQGHENVQEPRQHRQPARPDARLSAPTSCGCGRCRSTSPRTTASARRYWPGSPTSIASCATPSAICSARSTGSATRSGSTTSRNIPSSSATCSTSPPSSTRSCAARSMTSTSTRYVRALTDFANEDLSAFYFDIRKDSLYCDAPASVKRRAYRTVLDTLFHALVRWLAPVLVFTTEEVWGTRFPDAGSVHLLEWPEMPPVDARRCEVDGVARASRPGDRSDRAAAPRQGRWGRASRPK